MVLAFDGICVLCNGFVRFMGRHDRQGRFRYASSTSAVGAALFISAGQDPGRPVSVILVGSNRTFVESSAIIRAVAALGGFWRLIAIARIVPRPLRDAAYRVVARNRYRWFGKLETCPLPDPAWADRFLT